MFENSFPEINNGLMNRETVSNNKTLRDLNFIE